MKFTKYFMPFAALALLASCSDDKVMTPEDSQLPSEGTRGGMYVTLNVKELGTRAADTQAGETFENGVKEVVILLVQDDDVKHSFSISTEEGWKINGSTANTQAKEVGYTMTGEVDRETWKTLQTQTNNTYKLYAVCNPTTNLKSTLLAAGDDFMKDNGETITLTALSQIDSELAVVGASKFLMSNADNDEGAPEASLAVSATQGKEVKDFSNLKNYNEESDPFKLGTIRVQRAVARFDYKPVKTNNEYTPEGTKAKITLVGMYLANIGEGFSLFKQVGVSATENATIAQDAATITPRDNWTWTYLKEEEPASAKAWTVYNPRYDENLNLLGAATTHRFFQPMFETYGTTGAHYDFSTWEFDDMPSSAGDYKVEPTYYFWKYATPNTMHDWENQKKVLTTAVIFKAKMEDVDEGNYFSQSGNPKVYAYNNVILGSFDQLKSAVEDDEDGEGFAVVFNNVKDKYETAEQTETNMKEDLVKNGFTVYTYETDSETPTNSGYYCYYTYMNKHINNSEPTMGNMEFGVVRNNIYKLSVTEINLLGHPANPGDDPDPDEPDDDDEEVKMYLSVDIVVVPWTVRSNEIEF